MSKNINREKLTHLLEDVSRELEKRKLTATIFMVGGAAMSIAYNHDRVTRDVDAIFIPAPEMREVIEQVGERNDLEHDWLNDGAKGFMPGNDPNAETVYNSSSLTVYVPSREYLLAMKVHAGRDDRDYSDAALLAKQLGYTRAEQIEELLVSYYGRQVQIKHRYIAREVITQATGTPTSQSTQQQLQQQQQAPGAQLNM